MTAETKIEAGDQLPVYPWAGIGVTIFATFMAVALTPDEPEPKGALFLPSLVMAVGLLLVPLATAFRSLKSILRGEHLLVLAPIYWLLLDQIQSAYEMERITTDEVKTSFIAIGLFVCGVWLACFHRPWRLPKLVVESASYDIRPNAFFTIIVVSFLLGMFKYAYPCDFDPLEMLFYLTQPRFDAPWARTQLGSWNAFRDHMQYFGYLLPAFTVVMASKSGWLNFKTLISLVLSVTISAFLAQEGGRRIIGVIFGMAIILWVLSQKQIRMRVFLPAAIGIGTVLFIMQTMLEYRNIGLGVMLIEDEFGMDVQKPEYIHVDDNFLRLAQIVQLVPAQYPHVWEKYPIYVLVRPIPRVFWAGKPVDPGFDLPSALGLRMVSLSSSAVGELWVTGGFWAVILGGWVYGSLAGMASRLLTQGAGFGAHVVYSAAMMALFAGVRSMLDLVLISYVVLAWIFICWLYRLFHKGPVALPVPHPV